MDGDYITFDDTYSMRVDCVVYSDVLGMKRRRSVSTRGNLTAADKRNTRYRGKQ